MTIFHPNPKVVRDGFYYANYFDDSLTICSLPYDKEYTSRCFDVLKQKDYSILLRSDISMQLKELLDLPPMEQPKFYYQGKLHLLDSIDSHLILINDKFSNSISLYLFNISNGVMKSWALLSDSYYESDGNMGHWYSVITDNTIYLYEYYIITDEVWAKPHQIKQPGIIVRMLDKISQYKTLHKIKDKYELVRMLLLYTEGHIVAN